MNHNLDPFLKPRGVVVIGASTSPEKLGYGVARNLITSGYPGNIQFVSQRPGKLFDRPLHMDLTQASDPLDLAVLIVPAQEMVNAIHACGRRGIRAAILISSGFREAGREGELLELRCVEAARLHHIRLIGPNCIGIINTHLPLDTTFLQPPMPASGNIGFISQSGAFCAAMIDLMRDKGFGFSQIISLGNQADISEAEVLPAVSANEDTRVVVLYMESVSDGRNFVEVARQVTRQKPVVALKVGRFEAGRQAAASHTGALAGADNIFEAAFEKSGILRADTAEQMFDWARTLADCPLPRGRRVAILTNAGGPGVIAADALESNQLELARLTEGTRQALSAVLPTAASLHNPIDMLASASPEVYAACLRALLDDQNVDQVLLILPPPPMFPAEAVASMLIPLISNNSKPVVVSLMGSLLTQAALKCFENRHIPTFPFPERAVSALGALANRSEDLAELSMETVRQVENQTPHPADIGLEFESSELLRAYGIQVLPVVLAQSAAEAVSIASKTGFPVVLKIASPDISHKSDVDGVLLNLKDQSSVRKGFAQLMERAKTARPEAHLEGVLVQKQISGGQEVILGMQRDPSFGPVIMFGSGGTEVEELRDVAFSLAPLSIAEAERMLAKTWAGRRLKGYRNIPPVDEQAVKDALVRLSRLAMEYSHIQEIEINPLVVLPHGAVAVDIRVVHSA